MTNEIQAELDRINAGGNEFDLRCAIDKLAEGVQVAGTENEATLFLINYLTANFEEIVDVYEDDVALNEEELD